MKKILFIFFILLSNNFVAAQNILPDLAGQKYRTFLDDILYTFTAKNYFKTLLTSFQHLENPQKAVVATVVKTEEKNRDPVADFYENKDMVRSVQKYLGLNTDGIVGKNTQDAIKTFQKNNNITPEAQFGKVDKNTLEKLDELIDSDTDKKRQERKGVNVGQNICNTNNTLRDVRRRFTKLEDCWVQGDTGHFGTEWNGSPDITPGRTKGFNPAYAKTTSMAPYAVGKKINILDPGIGIVSLPLDVQKYFFGTQLSAEEIKKIYSGTPIEIVNISNNNCVVAPLWETGPGDGEISKPKAIDLTPIVKKQIGGKSFISKFRPVQAGKRGCEGYNLKFVFQDQILKKNTQVAELKK